MSPLELYHRADASLYQEYLSRRPRWTKYKGEVSDAEWRKLLGADVDSNEQPRLMLGLAKYCIDQDPRRFGLTTDEEDILYKAVAMQSWGKSFDPNTRDGNDIYYEDLTQRDIQRRREKFFEVYDALVPDGETKERFLVASTLYDKDTRLGDVFDSIKRLSYMRIAGIAYDQSIEIVGHDDSLSMRLAGLSADVAANQIIPLLSQAERYPAVKKVLVSSAERITAIMSQIDDAPRLNLSEHTTDTLRYALGIWERSVGFTVASKPAGNKSREGLFTDRPSFQERLVTDLAVLEQRVKAIRSLGGTIALTSGSFDMVHIGHARYLAAAANLADFLVVGVDSDEKIRSRKGPGRPVVGEDERLEILAHLRGVSLVFLKDAREKRWELIRRVHPDTLIVTAETYSVEEIEELEAKYCGRVVVLEPQATTSTSARIRKFEIDAADGAGREAKRRMGQGILDLIDQGADPQIIREYVTNAIGDSGE